MLPRPSQNDPCLHVWSITQPVGKSRVRWCIFRPPGGHTNGHLGQQACRVLQMLAGHSRVALVRTAVADGRRRARHGNRLVRYQPLTRDSVKRPITDGGYGCEGGVKMYRSPTTHWIAQTRKFEAQNRGTLRPEPLLGPLRGTRQVLLGLPRFFTPLQSHRHPHQNSARNPTQQRSAATNLPAGPPHHNN